MTAVALVRWHGSHQLLMTARDHAARALVVCRSPLEALFLPSGEALCGHRDPLLACGKESAKSWGELRLQGAIQTTRWLANSCRVWASRVTVV